MTPLPCQPYFSTEHVPSRVPPLHLLSHILILSVPLPRFVFYCFSSSASASNFSAASSSPSPSTSSSSRCHSSNGSCASRSRSAQAVSTRTLLASAERRRAWANFNATWLATHGTPEGSRLRPAHEGGSARPLHDSFDVCKLTWSPWISSCKGLHAGVERLVLSGWSQAAFCPLPNTCDSMRPHTCACVCVCVFVSVSLCVPAFVQTCAFAAANVGCSCVGSLGVPFGVGGLRLGVATRVGHPLASLTGRVRRRFREDLDTCELVFYFYAQSGRKLARTPRLSHFATTALLKALFSLCRSHFETPPPSTWIWQNLESCEV